MPALVRPFAEQDVALADGQVLGRCTRAKATRAARRRADSAGRCRHDGARLADGPHAAWPGTWSRWGRVALVDEHPGDEPRAPGRFRRRRAPGGRCRPGALAGHALRTSRRRRLRSAKLEPGRRRRPARDALALDADLGAGGMAPVESGPMTTASPECTTPLRTDAGYRRRRRRAPGGVADVNSDAPALLCRRWRQHVEERPHQAVEVLARDIETWKMGQMRRDTNW